MVNVLYTEHQEILRHLIRKGVHFILIGGYAVIAHGYERTTGDMDLWIKPDNSNKLLLLEALRELGFEKRDLDIIATKDFEQPFVFSIGEKPLRVDFLTTISGVQYGEADAQKIIAEIDGIQLPVLHLNHLVLSKFVTGRLKDKADIEELQRIEAQRKK